MEGIHDDELNSLGITPLMRAVGACTEEGNLIVTELIALGHVRASLFAKDCKGRTALDWARLTRNEVATAILVKAMDNEIDESRYNSAFAVGDVTEHASDMNRKYSLDLLRELEAGNASGAIRVINNADIFRDEVESIPHKHIVFFTDKPSDIGTINNTPLILACGMNALELVNILIDKGAPLEDTNRYGHNPLTWAATCGHAEVVRLLLFKGANINHQTLEGRTVLHCACLYLKAKVVHVVLKFMYEKFLVYRISKHQSGRYDADRWTRYASILENFIQTRDKSGCTAFELAPENMQVSKRLSNNLLLTVPGGENENNSQRAGWNDEDGQLSVSTMNTNAFRHDSPDSPNNMPNGPEYATGSDLDGMGVDYSSIRGDADETEVVEGVPGNSTSSIVDDKSVVTMDDSQLLGNAQEHCNQSTVSATMTNDTDNNVVNINDNHGMQVLKDEYSVATAMSFSTEYGTLKKLFDEAHSRISVWRVSAAREEELGREIFCWLQCGYQDSVENISTHIKDACPHRAVECPECRNILYAKDIKEHRKDICPKRLVGCPNAWQGCTEIVQFDFLEKHLTMKCELRLVPCRLLCGKNNMGDDGEQLGALLPFNKRENHEKYHCSKRQLECDQCHQMMIADTYTNHLHNDCPDRKIRCSVGCGMFIRAKDLSHHEEKVCKAPCKWNCGLVIGPQQRKNYHELSECGCRPVKCRNAGCTAEGFMAKYIEEHERFHCGHVMEFCPNSCGKRLKRVDIPKHIENWYGDCVERLVRCPCNYVGWKVRVNGTEEGHVLKYERIVATKQSKLNTTISVSVETSGDDKVSEIMAKPGSAALRGKRSALMVDHEITLDGMDKIETRGGIVNVDSDGSPLCTLCSPRATEPVRGTSGNSLVGTTVVPVQGDRLYVRFENKHQWVDFWKVPILPLQRSQGDLKIDAVHRNDKFDCKWIKYSQLSEHLTNDCIHRLVKMPQTKLPPPVIQSAADLADLPEDFGTEEYLLAHGVSPSRAQTRQRSRQGTRQGKRRSETPGSEKRPRKLPRGGETVGVSTSVDGGLTARSGIAEGNSTDVLSRGNSVPYKDAVKAAVELSGYEKFLNTGDIYVNCEFCSVSILPDVYGSHIKNECGSVVQRCKLGCGLKMQRKQMDSHVDNDCPKRSVHCPQCYTDVWAEELEQHLADDCMENGVKCGLGCPQKGLTRSTEEHHRIRECLYRLMVCTCGQQMRIVDHNDHLIADCTNKLTLCPQGCGEYVPRDRVDNHLENDCRFKSIYFSAIISCPMGCGIRLKRKEVLVHVSYSCVMRLCDCPLKCGNSIKVDKMRTHLYFCPMRFLTCETGMVCCNKRMHEWFYHDYNEDAQTKPDMMKEDDERSLEVAGEDFTLRSQSMTDSDFVASASEANPLTIEDDSTNYHADVSTVASTAAEGFSIPYRTAEQLGELREPLGGPVGRESGDVSLVGSDSIASSQQLVPRGKQPANRVIFNESGSVVSGGGTTATPVEDSVITGHASMTSSVYFEDGRVLLKDRLRLIPCKRHQVTALMAAIRADEFALVEFVVRSTMGMDLDMQSMFGDTALTLACRFQRYSMVELLIQNGADLNMETTAGRTALMEAVKVNDVKIADLLIYNGALVQFKTTKHGKTATDWAKQLKLVDMLRSLELGSIVQVQIKQIFNYISCGEIEKIRELIGEGDFFDATTPYRTYKDMEENITLLRKSKAHIETMKSKLYEMNAELVTINQEYQKEVAAHDDAEKHIDEVFAELNHLRVDMNRIFVAYENLVHKLSGSDINEVAHMRQPVEPVRMAVLSYGYLMEIFDLNKDYGVSMAETREWWPQILPTLLDTYGSVKKLRAFSIAKLQTPLMVNLLKKARELYKKMMASLYAYEQEQLNNQVETKSSPTVKLMLKRDPSASALVSKPVETFESAGVADDVIPDVDWDSEAEEAGGGKFVKGEWVPDVKKKAKWWETEAFKRKQEALEVHGDKRKKRELEKRKKEEAEAAKLKEEKEWEEKQWKSDSVLAVYSRKYALRPGAGESKVYTEDDDEFFMDESERPAPPPIVGGTVTGPSVVSVAPAIADLAGENESPSPDTKFNRAKKQSMLGELVMLTGIVPPEEVTGMMVSAGSGSNSPIGSLSPSRQLTYDDCSVPGSAANDDGSVGTEVTTASGKKRTITRSEKKRLAKIEAEKQRQRELAEKARLDELERRRKAINPVEVIENIFGSDSAAAGVFVSTIVTLLYAVDCVANDSAALAEANQNYVKAVNSQHDCKDKVMMKKGQLSNKELHKGLLEKKLFDELSQCKFYLRKTKIFRDKLRISRLLNQITPCGHTAISWAATHGNYEAVEELLTHGSSVGYTEDLVHLSARFLQMSYRLYRFVSCKTSLSDKKLASESEDERVEEVGSEIGSGDEGDSVDDESSVAKHNAAVEEKKRKVAEAAESTNLSDGNAFNNMVDAIKSGNLQMSNTELVEKIFLLKEERTRVLNTIKHRRFKLRLPIPEAAYNGKWEVIHRIHERKLFHVNMSSQYAFPSPPPPRPRVRHYNLVRTKHTMMELVAHGMSNLAAGEYVVNVGWVGANDERESFGECQENCSRVWTQAMEDRDKFIAARRRIRYLINAKRMMAKGELDLIEAIRSRDYKKAMHIAQTGGGSVDYEASSGYTILLAAAEENVGSQTHAWMLNDDGKPVLAVEYLLDREDYRPAVDLEVDSGLTALIRACSINRIYVVQALLDRGASVNKQNRFGKTAMHYAAATGSHECVRLLLERGADISIKDAEGKSSYDIANEMGFTSIMQQISRYCGGNLGPVKVTRGRIIDTVSCPFACGLTMYPHERKTHVFECRYREVECPLKCGIRRLQFREIEEHCAEECKKRLIECKKCHKEIVCELEEEHWNSDCSERLLPCPLKCGNTLRQRDMPGHMSHCTYRLVPCPQQCGEEIMVRDSYDHCRQTCILRRVSCPNKCAKLILFNKLETHVNTMCPLRLEPCKWCGEAIRYRVLAAHLQTCDSRCIECPSKCGVLVHHASLKDHLANACGFRFISCPLECILKVRVCDMDLHISSKCENRFVDCPNGCMVVMTPEQQLELLGSSVLPPAESNDSVVPANAENQVVHESLSEVNISLSVMQVTDAGLLPGSHSSVSANDDEEEAFGYTTDQIEGRELKNSELLCQPCDYPRDKERSVGGLAGLTDSSFVANTSMMNNSVHSHLTPIQDTQRYFVENGVYKVKAKVRAKTLHLHVQFECPERAVVCGLCRETLKGKEFERHTKVLCERRTVACRIHGCMKELAAGDREAHERFECRFRLIPCVQGCDALVPAIDMGRHSSKACSMRQVACPLQCGLMLRHYAVRSHTENDCARRFVDSSPIATPDFSRHPSRRVLSRQGSFAGSPPGSRPGSTTGTPSGSPVGTPTRKTRKKSKKSGNISPSDSPPGSPVGTPSRKTRKQSRKSGNVSPSDSPPGSPHGKGRCSLSAGNGTIAPGTAGSSSLFMEQS